VPTSGTSEDVRVPTPVPPDQSARARSFGAAAADYHRARTGYTEDDVAWALDLSAGRTAARLRVLDLAAGTGRLTLALLAAGVGAGGAVGTVYAVEPDPGMRAEFARQVPPGLVRLHDGTAEAIPLPDASVDAVVVGSAFHWFDPSRALPEIARVLRPGGTLTALWTQPDEEVDWVRAYRRAARNALAAATGQETEPEREPEPDRYAGQRHLDIPASPLFSDSERRQTVHLETTTRADLATAIGTYSDVLVADPAGRRAALLAVVAELDRLLPAGADAGPDPHRHAGTDPDAEPVQLPVRVRLARRRRL
jgi:SAM-dependent methyltransferase